MGKYDIWITTKYETIQGIPQTSLNNLGIKEP